MEVAKESRPASEWPCSSLSPSARRGFISLFQDHPRIEFVPFDLPQLLADREFTLALVGLHGNQLTPALLGAIRGVRPNLRLIVMGPDADDEVILGAIGLWR